MFSFGSKGLREAQLADAMRCCAAGKLDQLTTLVSKDISLVTAANKGGNTLLHVVCHQGRLDMVIMLVLRGADVNRADNDDFTPLMVALQFKHSDCALFLIEHGANVNTSNFIGNTPLHLACIFGAVDSVDQLLEAGAEINALDQDGRTPLMCAIPRGHVVAVHKLLVHPDVAIDVKDGHGEDTLTLLQDFGMLDAQGELILPAEYLASEALAQGPGRGEEMAARDAAERSAPTGRPGIEEGQGQVQVQVQPPPRRSKAERAARRKAKEEKQAAKTSLASHSLDSGDSKESGSPSAISATSGPDARGGGREMSPKVVTFHCKTVTFQTDEPVAVAGDGARDRDRDRDRDRSASEAEPPPIPSSTDKTLQDPDNADDGSIGSSHDSLSVLPIASIIAILSSPQPLPASLEGSPLLTLSQPPPVSENRVVVGAGHVPVPIEPSPARASPSPSQEAAVEVLLAETEAKTAEAEAEAAAALADLAVVLDALQLVPPGSAFQELCRQQEQQRQLERQYGYSGPDDATPVPAAQQDESRAPQERGEVRLTQRQAWVAHEMAKKVGLHRAVTGQYELREEEIMGYYNAVCDARRSGTGAEKKQDSGEGDWAEAEQDACFEKGGGGGERDWDFDPNDPDADKASVVSSLTASSVTSSVFSIKRHAMEAREQRAQTRAAQRSTRQSDGEVVTPTDVALREAAAAANQLRQHDMFEQRNHRTVPVPRGDFWAGLACSLGMQPALFGRETEKNASAQAVGAAGGGGDAGRGNNDPSAAADAPLQLPGRWVATDNKPSKLKPNMPESKKKFQRQQEQERKARREQDVREGSGGAVSASLSSLFCLPSPWASEKG